MAEITEWGRLTEMERVDRWREQEALRIGCTAIQAQTIAHNRHIDVRELEAMVKVGCPIGTALKILT